MLNRHVGFVNSDSFFIKSTKIKNWPAALFPQDAAKKNTKSLKNICALFTIDFTDHGEPHIHANPHEHPLEPNPTGGTPNRGNARPLENWKSNV